MKKIILWLLIAVTGGRQEAFCQTLQTGDTMPDILLDKFFQKDTSFTMSSLRGKAVILDFWGHGCKGCIEAFPKMDSLQKIYGDSLVFIAVNPESIDSTRRFFKRFKKINIPSFLIAAGDTTVRKLFPGHYIPWHVWIDKYGVVRYITGSTNATEKNIRAFLNGEKMKFLPDEVVQDYDYNKITIAQPENKYSSKTIAYSSISRFIPNLSAGDYFYDSTGGGFLISKSQMSIVDLFLFAYSEGSKYNFNPKQLLEFFPKDSSRYFMPVDAGEWDGWLPEHAYTYEASFPAGMVRNGYEAMQEDLKRFFQLDARIITKPVKAYVIRRKDKRCDVFAERKGVARNSIFTDSTVEAVNVEFDRFIESWNESLNSLSFKIPDAVNASYPLVNGTGYHGKISIVRSFNTGEKFSIDRLRKDLVGQCMNIETAVIPLKVLRLEERSK